MKINGSFVSKVRRALSALIGDRIRTRLTANSPRKASPQIVQFGSRHGSLRALTQLG
jgi:hypothetical protein